MLRQAGIGHFCPEMRQIGKIPRLESWHEECLPYSMEILPCVYLLPSRAMVKLYPRVCFIYGWYRPNRGYLYIGSTRKGLKRFRHHHVINKAESVRSDDQLHIWVCGQPELKDKEFLLTKRFAPYYNTLEGSKKRGLTGVVLSHRENISEFK